MKKGFFYTLLLCASLLSCRDSSKKTPQNLQEVTNEQIYVEEFLNNFIVEIELNAPENDAFHVFYLTESFQDYFKGDQAIGKSVKGNESFQKIRIELPKDTIPTRLRIDLGQNKDQKQIILNSIKLIYEDKEFLIKDSLFTKYFSINKFGKVQADGRTINLLQDEDGTYDPYIIGKVWLNRSLKELIESP